MTSNRSSASRTLPHFLRQNLDLLRHLVRREFLLTYRRSALGLLWSLLLPLAQLVVLAFVFQHVLPLNIEAYPAFLLSALLPWTWFTTSVVGATGIFLGNRDLMRRPNFGPGVLVVVTTLSNLLTFLCAVPILLAVLWVYGRPLGAALLMFPVLLAVQAMLIVGVGLITATLNAFYRDVTYVVSIALLLLFYLTPIFYKGDASLPGYALVAKINPLAGLIQSYRDIFFNGVVPPFSQFGFSALLSVMITAAGYWLYRRCQHDLIDAL